jgi:hypothetical protein
VHPGSIPGVASIFFSLTNIFPLTFILMGLAPAPPHFQTPTQSPDDWQVNRQDQETKGNHPETEDGQKSQQATENQSNTDNQPKDAGARQMKMAIAKFDSHGH